MLCQSWLTEYKSYNRSKEKKAILYCSMCQNHCILDLNAASFKPDLLRQFDFHIGKFYVKVHVF